MKVSTEILDILVNRLKIGNRRGVHLNILPGSSRYKFDITRFETFDEKLSEEFIRNLLTESKFNFIISPKKGKSYSEEKEKELNKTSRTIQNLINHSESLESEKGINSFGFGYPTLIFKSKSDNQLIFAPILIWSMKIKGLNQENTFQITKTEEDPIYVNEVLINYLESDNGIKIENISSELIEDGLIDHEELIGICNDIFSKFNSNQTMGLPESLEEIEKLRDKSYYQENLKETLPCIIKGGLFSIYEVQKQNLINDYNYLKGNLEKIDLKEFYEKPFQSISSIKTDPSQQGILNSLSKKRNLIIQGPPGTGKSQSLTAILVNCLENNKKTLVVCEKRTALEVLESNLKDLGLSNMSILIKDSSKDRKTVVDSVRSRIDNVKYKNHYYPFNKETYELKLNEIESLINTINKSHKKLSKKEFNNQSWSDLVGNYLNLKNEGLSIDIGLKSIYKEVNKIDQNHLSSILPSLESKFKKSKLYNNSTFLNPRKLNSDNSFITEKELLKEIKNHDSYINEERLWFEDIEKYYQGNLDFFNFLISKSFKYKFSSIFSKEKKELIRNQVQYTERINNLFNSIKKNELINQDYITPLINRDNPPKSFENLLDFQKQLKNHYVVESDQLLNEIDWITSFEKLNKEEKQLVIKLQPHSNWNLIFQNNLFDSLLDYYASNDLPLDFDSHKRLIDLLEEIKNLQLKYINDLWFSNLIESSRNFYEEKGILVENLYNKRSSQKFKRNSLRQIVKTSIDLFTDYFPIILTTPDVASNLFGMMKESYFDFVLFDEASQLRLEDTLPSILKGKQVIVAGDEHQMPPSNYFSKVYDGQDENEIEDDADTFNPQDFLLGSESLLEFSSEFGFEKYHLDFHYRSRHPDLIQFSNYAFYEGRLKPMLNTEDYNPITFYQVSGIYSDNVNQDESDFVVKIIDEKIKRLPNGKYPSVGIATFNISQRDLIIEKLNQKRRSIHSNDFNFKMMELEKEGFFVKNLENIQGDERDVIILSTTYGVNHEGKFRRGFGQINQQKGYKLLNVIITRAKHKLYVCTSIPESEYLSYKELLVKEGSNNRFSVFYAYLSYCKSISERDENLKQSILNSLLESNLKLEDQKSNNHSSTLIEYLSKELSRILPEFEVKKNQRISEFEVDLVLELNENPEKKIIIEVDGNKDHNSEESYLIDIYREEVFKKFGYIILRIWSTNWWRNSDKELKSLVSKINENKMVYEKRETKLISDSFLN